jgi:hypothetical protein
MSFRRHEAPTQAQIEEAPMKSIERGDMKAVPILVSEEGFPGELSQTDVARARGLIRSSDSEAVLVAAGAGAFWWVDAEDQQAVRLVGSPMAPAGEGFALGAGDGATLPGVPLDWELLTFRCPHGDTTVFLAQLPAEPPNCPIHEIPLEFQDAGG